MFREYLFSSLFFGVLTGPFRRRIDGRNPPDANGICRSQKSLRLLLRRLQSAWRGRSSLRTMQAGQTCRLPFCYHQSVARTCSVCTHDAAEAINAGLDAGPPLRALAAEYGLSRSSLDRHKRFHLWAGHATISRTGPPESDLGVSKSAATRPSAPIKKWSIPAWLRWFLAGYLVRCLQQAAAAKDTSL